MLLMLERWEGSSQELEIAALLDEAPYHKYRATEAGEAWRAESALTEAARSVDTEGSAWLFVVYKSDEVETWGKKRVRVHVGGEIMRAEVTQDGLETGRYKSMRFESVAPEVFGTMYGKATEQDCQVVINAHMTYDPKVMKNREQLERFRDEEPDPIFGWVEKQVKKEESARRPPLFAPPAKMGCDVKLISNDGKSERWFLSDTDGLVDFRFELTEFQRRPYVQIILSRLGFVRDKTVDGGEPPSLEQVSSGLVRNVAMSLKSLTRVAAAYDKMKPR